MLQRSLPAGFIAPCLPSKTDKLPSGSQWLHEIKHDGFRIIARKKGSQVRLYSRPGNDFTHDPGTATSETSSKRVSETREAAMAAFARSRRRE
jgi:ATP-dependent DNA ligase